jgi:hypothetical protein
MGPSRQNAEVATDALNGLRDTSPRLAESGVAAMTCPDGRDT